MAKKKVSSVYKIVNLKTNKVYVGSAVDTHVRWLKHKRDLLGGKHHSNKLQRAFDKYGEENFKYEIIEVCDKKDLLIRENYYLNKFNSYKGGYNCTITTENPMKGRKHTKKTKLLMSKAKKGRKLTEKHKKKISESMKGVSRGSYSDEHRESISKSLVGNKLSEKHKENISKGRKGKNTKKILQYSLGGELIKEWGSITECFNVLGINYSSISKNLRGKLRKTNNFIFKYV